MVERLHPGVFVEERRRGVAPIQGVSTSTFGTVGFTPRGPTNVATLVTSFEQFERTFGSFTELGQVPTQVFAFFANGGRRALVVRVVASDALFADGFVGNTIGEQVADSTPDGVLKAFGDTLANLPVRPSSVTFRYREPGTPVVAEASNETPATDGVAGVGTLDFSGKIGAGGLPIVPGSVTVDTTVSAGSVPYTDSAADGILRDAGTEIRGFIDYETGLFNLSAETGQSPDAASSITVDYTPVGTERTVTDDGAGALNGTTLAAPGTINYTTGVWAFTVDAGSTAPAANTDILVDYIQDAFDIDPISAGIWGNGLRIDVSGNDNYFDSLTGLYSRHNVDIFLDDDFDGTFDLLESFTEISFTDPADSNYFATAINDPDLGSNLIEVVTPSNADVSPESLGGKARTQAAGAGNSVTVDFGSTAAADPDGFPSIPVGVRGENLQFPVLAGSVVITYTDATATARTITDDGLGNLIGDVDPAAPVGFNKIDYDTGKYAFRTVAPVSEAETSHLAVPTGTVAGSLATVVYRQEPVDLVVQDTLSGGSDGVAPIGRNELTDPSLKTDREGMYALLTLDELLNIAIPDAAGDVTMATDQIAEAETNQKWFIILASPPGLTPLGVRSYRRNQLGVSSSYGALYYPYIRIADPVTDRGLNIPPQGHIAGVYARTDTEKNVGKAPAGTSDGRLNFSIGLERNLEFAEIDVFFQSQVNALVDTPQTGRVVWGARSLENPPDDFRYVHVRRLFNFLKASIFNATHGFVFENVGASLRSLIRLSVESFLGLLFTQGMFKGERPQDAFAVVCDETNNPPEVEDSGTVICDIFIAPNKPGEFIVFRLQQKFTTT